MPLQELHSPPRFMGAEEFARHQEATPSSFQGHPPVLRLTLDNVVCSFQPRFSPLETNSDHATGTLWITEDSICYLTPESKGFQLDYPSLSLHAISRSMPASLIQNLELSTSDSRGCIYCQVDSSANDAGDDEDVEVFELWILPQVEESLDSLFSALSHCASLHPSAIDDEEGSGNPFGSIGSFGDDSQQQTNGHMDTSDDAFDDAEEEPQADEHHLSETGRATLHRLESIIDWPEGKSDPKRVPQASQPTNTLNLDNVPSEIFQHTDLARSLLDLLHAYGSLYSWTPLPGLGRAIIIYEEVQGAMRAKEALDRLLLPLVEEGNALEDVDIDQVVPQKGVHGYDKDSVLRAYFGDEHPLYGDEDSRLSVPNTDRNFLISPPGSPPVGWEPIKEDPPNTATLADDLIRALGSLRDKGLGVEGYQPVSYENDDRRTSRHISPPEILMEPRQTRITSFHPLVRQEEEQVVSLPGVSVQNTDGDHNDDSSLNDRPNKNLSISSVKATVESMRGETKIQPTSRPPLA